MNHIFDQAWRRPRTFRLLLLPPLVALAVSCGSGDKKSLIPGTSSGNAPAAAASVSAETKPSTSSPILTSGSTSSVASIVEKIGPGGPKPRREGGYVVYERPAGSRPPDEAALDLFLAVEEGLKKAAVAASVPCELTGVFLEPGIASAVFSRGSDARAFDRRQP